MALWSKRHDDGSPYPLISHLLDTAASATVLWDDWLRPGLRDLIKDSLGPDARAWVAAAAGLHDIGKASPVFAGQLAARSAEPWHELTRKSLLEDGFDLDVPVERVQSLRRHEKVSGLSLARTDLDFGDRIAEDWIAAAALGHHGKFQIPETPECRAFTRSAGGAWQDSREELTAQVMAACGLNPDAALPEASPAVAVLIAGLVVLADRTASEWISVKRADEELRSGALSLDDHAGWMSRRASFFASRLNRTIGTYNDFGDSRTAIAGDYDLRPLQEAALTAGDGLWVAMAPTGNGKTEAALLRHASKAERLIFALPTQATTNAMMKRVQAAYQGTGNVAELAHRLASVEDFYAQAAEHRTADGAGLIPSEFLRNGTARLLAPVSVSTIDQVLAGSLRTKWAHLRLLTLANAHVVIDEAHLMDQYQSALATQLMKWWGATGTRITLLSATLPQWQRDAFASAYDATWNPSEIVFPSHEMIPGTQETLDQNSYGITVTTVRTKETVQAHANWVVTMKTDAPNARLGVVVNTVGRAQELAGILQSQGITPILLHSRMTAGHRRDAANRLLAEIGKGGQGVGTVVIGTQAIEASLDIDLDAMSTDLAPAPSLIQRAGRVWRHADEQRRATRLQGVTELPLHIVCADSKWGALPYFHSELRRVENFLTGRARLQMPEDSQAFVEASALRIDEVDWAEQEEMAEYARRFAKAGGVVINATELTDPDADLETLMRLTGHDVDEETATRLIEPPTATALIIDPDGRAGVPGAWTGTLKELENIDTSDRTALRTAMEATVPLNGRLARRALEISNPWTPESRVLQGMTPVIIGQAGVIYDNLLGIITVDEL